MFYAIIYSVLYFSVLVEESESLKEVTMLVGKVDEMRKQRAMLASQLRESICSDDITTILVTRNSENIEALFEDELKKHDRYVSFVIYLFFFFNNVIQT